jgi:hypothetical protein
MGQLLKIMSDIKWYIFKSIKSIQPIQFELIQLELAHAAVVINHQMVVIQV